MSVLIFGHENDEHALAVRQALLSESIACEIFCNDLYPRASTISIDPACGAADLEGPDISAVFSRFDTVWNRRRKPAGLPDDIHPADRAIARSECEALLQQLRIVEYPHQTWVNPEVSQFRIRGKLNQLMLAHAVGLTIPKTLISNDPVRVRAFLSDTPEAIVKAIDKQGWSEDGTDIVLPTSPVTFHDCDDDTSISMCPMIYQERVEKAFELRIVVFGDELVCVRLDSQERTDSRTDWRSAPPNSFPIKQIDVPRDLAGRIRAFCHRAGIIHGSFDFAIDQRGNAVFFELNVQGQSLWIEDWNPDIRILDRLVAFLKAPARTYRYSGAQRHSFRDFLDRHRPMASVPVN